MLTSTQIGTIAENLVVNALLIESEGRFSPFRPVADDNGIDILAYDKPSGMTVPLQVKARTMALKKRGRAERGNTVHFEVRRATFTARTNGFCACVLLSEDGSAIKISWLIPMNDIVLRARSTKTKFVVRANMSARSRDKYADYRCSSASEMVRRLCASIDM